MIESSPPERLLTTTEAARFLGIARATLERWRQQGEGPPYRKLGRKVVRYSMGDLWTYLDQMQRIPRELEK